MLTPASEVGMDEARLQAAVDLFHAQVHEQRLHPGAQLAVYRRGRLVLDLQVGLADAQQGYAMGADTLMVLYSSTKPLAALALLQLVERGRLRLDDPVAVHWPEFAAHGKADITVRQVLTHRAGLAHLPASVTWRDWLDWARMIHIIENMTPAHPPGAKVAYHPLSFGWLVGELVRRIDGRDVGRVVREEIAEPLGMHHTHLGLPVALLPQVAKLHAMEGISREGRGSVRIFNQPSVQQAQIPGANGISTARDMARLYAALSQGGALQGVRILGNATLHEALQPEAEQPTRDRTLGYSVLRGLGFELGGVRPLADRKGQTATLRTFGHGGMGTSVCWGDTELELALAFIPNGFREGMQMIRRCREISDAVRAACADRIS